MDAVSGKTFETIDPSTEQVICRVQEADKADVDIAVKAARKAFEPWRNTSPMIRSQLLNRWADLIEQNADYIAQLESMDNGKPVSMVKNADLFLVTQCLRYYAGWCDKSTGSTIPSHGDFVIYTQKEPIGVCGQIIPWNFPLLMMIWKMSPALATGNTLVLKTAEQTPLSALYVAHLAREAGFPPGVINVLSGFGETAGDAIARHMDVDKISFTGSTEVGKKIQVASGQSNLKPATLELGGKSPLIILDDLHTDALVEAAVNNATAGIFFNQGQVCSASSRVYIPEKYYEDFLACSKEKSEKRVVGDPRHESTEQGPQVNKEQFEKILGYIDTVGTSGRIVTGGKRFGNKGFFIEPTVIADVHDEAKVVKEEIFGPVMTALKYSDVEEVVRRANNSPFGLAAGVWTNDLTKALKVVHNLKAGTVWVNCWNAFHSNAPFGGFKQSGIGRDLGEAALSGYTQNKSVIIHVPGIKHPIQPVNVQE